MGDNKNSESPLDPQKILISSNHKYWDVARVSQDLKNQDDYSKWASIDSTMKKSYKGIDATPGFVAAWDNVTGVLKYYQPVGLATAGVGYVMNQFTSSLGSGGSLTITGSSMSGTALSIHSSFDGESIVINNTTYQLGSYFTSGISSSEYNNKSGEIIYIDNRFPVPRSKSQKEDIKIVLEF